MAIEEKDEILAEEDVRPLKSVKKRNAHLVREAWRYTQLQTWRATDRRVTRAVGEQMEEVDMQRFTAARRLYETEDGIGRAVLSGACYTPAALSVARPGTSPDCIWGCGAVGTHEHICWECEMRPPGYPDRPVDEYEARLAWPPDRKITPTLTWLKHVVDEIWCQRYPNRRRRRLAARAANPGEEEEVGNSAGQDEVDAEEEAALGLAPEEEQESTEEEEEAGNAEEER